ncbi:MAG TPA: hypothetical protein VEQ63_08995, partial [Bryobacteraceae bacterium]|nr:hypothetical protein [Bryobacteraceae bacterium]
YTRLKTESTGGGGYAVGSTLSNLNAFPRASVRVAPTHNFVDDVTWNKGRHTVQTGANIRLVVNDRTNFNNYPTYSFGRNTLDGLGNDITQPVLDLARAKYGNSGLTLTDANQLTNAMGTLLSLVNSYSLNFQFNREGQAIPVGEGIVRSYGTNEYEFYLQDTFKWRRDVTLTYGVRYGLYTVPYEKNGVQVSPTTGLDQFFADRVGGQAAGIPSNALPTAKLTYNLAGRANDAAGWYQTDKNNFAPRLSVAYAPEEGSFAARFLGKGSVIRAGAGTVYDRYGSSMIVSFATSGSPGLSTNVAQPVNTNFTTSFRYSGSELPKLQVPNGGMPFSPGTIVGGFNAFTGVSPDLKAPYSFVLDASYARPLPGGITVEVGYLGRLARKGLLRQDFAQALTQFKDPKSGQTWAQASGVLRDAFESGITPAQVRANPSLLPEVPFMENIFGKAANRTFTGSATANYFYSVYQTYAGSDLDALSAMDRTRLSDGTCISAYGCNTFFALQSAGLQTWVNAGYMNYHGGILTVRRAVQGGWGFDFNYTLSHAIDIASASEAASGGGALIQDSFNPSASRASANFDIRHNMNMNGIFELPFGKSKPFLNNAPGWVEQFVGGWQVSLLGRFRSGLPENITKGGVYQTNYLSSSLAILRPGASLPDSGVTYNQNGEPSIFANTSAANSFIGQYPGTVGSRNMIRGASLLNFDLSAAKTFAMPYHEGHRIQLRGEAFNAFNNVNFRNLSLSLATPTTFGRFSEAEDARVMQFALRYEF